MVATAFCMASCMPNWISLPAVARAAMASGVARRPITDFAAYREQVGYLRALTDLHSWCDEVATDLNKG